MARVFRFGPGFLESVTVRVWTARGSGGDRKKARVSGSVRLAREIDYDRFDLDESFSSWWGEKNGDNDGALVWLAANGDEDAARALAETAVTYALEEA